MLIIVLLTQCQVTAVDGCMARATLAGLAHLSPLGYLGLVVWVWGTLWGLSIEVVWDARVPDSAPFWWGHWQLT